MYISARLFIQSTLHLRVHSIKFFLQIPLGFYIFRYKYYTKHPDTRAIHKPDFSTSCYVMTNVKCNFLYTLNSSFYICFVNHQGYETGNFFYYRFNGSWPLCYSGISTPGQWLRRKSLLSFIVNQLLRNCLQRRFWNDLNHPLLRNFLTDIPDSVF